MILWSYPPPPSDRERAESDRAVLRAISLFLVYGGILGLAMLFGHAALMIWLTRVLP